MAEKRQELQSLLEQAMLLLPREAKRLIDRLNLVSIEIRLTPKQIEALDPVFFPDQPSLPVGIVYLPRSTLLVINACDLPNLCYECNRAIAGEFCSTD